jgi:hypothetical protein
VRLDTLASGESLSSVQVANRARHLGRRFAGQTLTVGQMYELGVGASRRQIMGICKAGDQGGYGSFDRQHAVMTWYTERLPDPTLDELLD